jgi:hypothetical protein
MPKGLPTWADSLFPAAGFSVGWGLGAGAAGFLSLLFLLLAGRPGSLQQTPLSVIPQVNLGLSSPWNLAGSKTVTFGAARDQESQLKKKTGAMTESLLAMFQAR